MSKETEDELQQAIKAGELSIEQAESLMAAMAHLKSLILIKEGAGQRYLQHIQPSIEQLKQVEQAILKQYSTTSTPSKQPKKSKSSLVRTISQRGV